MLSRKLNTTFCFALQCLIQCTIAFDAYKLAASLQARSNIRRCVIPANNDGTDDSPAIMAAFRECSQDSEIIFQNTTYNIAQAMSITNLTNVKIEVHGTLLWSKDIDYWLANSLPIGPGQDQHSYPPAAYQNQTTAFVLGGRNLYVEGFGTGTFDGNGQAWYDFVRGQSNYPNRPHSIVISAADSYLHGLRWVQPQMWTVTVVSSARVLLEDIYVNATSRSSQPARNTDGANTMFSDGITFRRWVVDNGDDCFAFKANSTNILVEDSVLYGGNGIAVGSIGQYSGRFETVENIVVRNVTMYGSKFATRIKTWTGEQNEWPPNGGGGGLGCELPNLLGIICVPTPADHTRPLSCAEHIIRRHHHLRSQRRVPHRGEPMLQQRGPGKLQHLHIRHIRRLVEEHPWLGKDAVCGASSVQQKPWRV